MLVADWVLEDLECDLQSRKCLCTKHYCDLSLKKSRNLISVFICLVFSFSAIDKKAEVGEQGGFLGPRGRLKLGLVCAVPVCEEVQGLFLRSQNAIIL